MEIKQLLTFLNWVKDVVTISQNQILHVTQIINYICKNKIIINLLGIFI